MGAPSPALIGTHVGSGVGINYRGLCGADSHPRSRPRTRERDWACSIGSFGDCPNPAFRLRGRERVDYELLWRLSAVLSDEDDSQDLEWTGSSRKE